MDDLEQNIHPRLFLRLPYTDPQDLFKASSFIGKQKLWDLKLATTDYKFAHTGMSGMFMPRGLGQVFDQACCNFDLSLLTQRNAQTAHQTKFQYQNVDGNACFEPMTPVVPISTLQQFKITFSAFEMLQKRLDPLDLSLEPVRAFLDWHDYFEGHSNAHTRVGLEPGVFCTQLVNMVRNENAQRWYKEEKFLDFSDLQGRLSSYAGQMQRNPDLYVTKNLDQSQSSTSDSKKSTKRRKYCPNYNSDEGCKLKDKAFCFINKEKHWHKCNKRLGPNSFCQKRHTRAEHEKAGKEADSGDKA